MDKSAYIGLINACDVMYRCIVQGLGIGMIGNISWKPVLQQHIVIL